MLKIARIVEDHGAEIAFPTHTVHVAPDVLEESLNKKAGSPAGAGRRKEEV